MGSQGIFRHQLLGNLPRNGLIDAALNVDFGEFIELKFRILAQLLTLRSRAKSARSVSDCELTDTHSPAAIDMAASRGTRNQDIVTRRGRRGDADDQACGRYDAVVGPEDCCA